MNREQLIKEFVESKREQFCETTLKIYEQRIKRILDKVENDITDSKLNTALYLVDKERELTFQSWKVYLAVLISFKRWYFEKENI